MMVLRVTSIKPLSNTSNWAAFCNSGRGTALNRSCGCWYRNLLFFIAATTSCSERSEETACNTVSLAGRWGMISGFSSYAWRDTTVAASVDVSIFESVSTIDMVPSNIMSTVSRIVVVSIFSVVATVSSSIE
ncbi:hypothetical protein SNK04_008099 [Fusarium graminearum]